MSITGQRKVEEGLFVPWRTAKRGGVSGGEPVGTLSLDKQEVGDSGGGTVAVQITANREEFGFPGIFVPTFVTTRDNLASPEVIRLAYVTVGNERISGDIEQHALALAGPAALNVATFDNIGIPLEFQGVTDLVIMQATWSTNTDTKVYHFHIFGYMFDAQLIAREGRISELLAGIR